MTPPTDSGWFEVHVTVRLRADDDNEAISRISSALAAAAIPGLYPVGDFSARSTDDPLEEARARRQGGEIASS